MAESNLNQIKTELRAKLKSQAESYLAENKSANKKVYKLLLRVLPSNGIVGSYQAMPGEPSLEGLIGLQNIRIAFPKIEDNGMSFYLPNTAESFVTGAYGILEPDAQNSKKIALNKLSTLLIPGLGFDRKCQRLGRGKGYYDRILKNYMGLKIGVATVGHIFSSDLPAEDHDVGMDIVVTDEFILKRFDT